MQAQLVQIGGPGQPRRVRLSHGRTLIGRDPEVGFYIESDRISRRHAVVQAAGQGHELGDLGSLNGTKLNGRPVEGFVLLRAGDRIELADAVTLVYQVRRAGAARAIGVAVLLGLTVTATFAGWRWWKGRPDPTLDHASVLARGAVLHCKD